MSCWAPSQPLPSCPSVNPYTLASVTDRPLICALARWFWMKETSLTTILYWIFKQLSSSTSYIFSFGRRSKKGQQSKEEWTFLFLVTKPVTTGTPGLPLVHTTAGLGETLMPERCSWVSRPRRLIRPTQRPRAGWGTMARFPSEVFFILEFWRVQLTQSSYHISRYVMARSQMCPHGQCGSLCCFLIFPSADQFVHSTAVVLLPATAVCSSEWLWSMVVDKRHSSDVAVCAHQVHARATWNASENASFVAHLWSYWSDELAWN